jgi:hypothetical protein
VLDDFDLRKLTAQESSDFYGVLVERDRRAATVITSNRAVDEWVALFDDPILAKQCPTASRIGRIRSSWRGRAYVRRGPPAPPWPPPIAERCRSGGIASLALRASTALAGRRGHGRFASRTRKDLLTLTSRS